MAELENFIFKGNSKSLHEFINNSEYYLIPIAKWDQLLIVYNERAFIFQCINNFGNTLSIESDAEICFIIRLLLEMHASLEFIDHVEELICHTHFSDDEYEECKDNFEQIYEAVKNQKTFKLDPEFYDIKTSDYYDKIGKEFINFDPASIEIKYDYDN